MKTHTKSLLIVSLLITLISCDQKDRYQNETSFGRTDFKLTQSLNGSTIEFDSLIMKPGQIQVYDSFLIINNQGGQKQFHIFNLKTKKKIGERISMGQGPTDMMLPFFVPQKDSIKLFDMMTSTLSTYTIHDFITNAEPIPVHQVKLSIQPLWSELALLGSNTIGTSYCPESPCYLFDSNGEKIKDFGTYPLSHLTYTDVEKTDAYRALLTSNGTDRVAVCHFFTDLINIYNEEGDLIKCLHGPDHFFPHFKEIREGDVVTAKAEKGTYRDAFYSPVSVGEDLFVLYNGKFVEEEDYNLLSQQLFVFGWDGTPKKLFILDQGVSRIAVDNANKKIYGISDSPEYHIVEFSYE